MSNEAQTYGTIVNVSLLAKFVPPSCILPCICKNAGGINSQTLIINIIAAATIYVAYAP